MTLTVGLKMVCIDATERYGAESGLRSLFSNNLRWLACLRFSLD
jgi:hypothetical protein